MAAAIVIKEGPLAGRRIELNGELVLGREDVSLPLGDPELSRRHAIIRPVAGGAEIEDLGSLNGTFVNSQRIDTPTRIGGGDTIKLGSSVLVLEELHASATVVSPTPAATPAAAETPIAAETPTATPVTPTPTPGLAPSEPFGTYAAPIATGRRGGIASRQLVPLLVSWAAVISTGAGLALYFALR